MLDEVAKYWKQSGGGVILQGEGDELENILRTIEGSMSGGKIMRNVLSRSNSNRTLLRNEDVPGSDASSGGFVRGDSRSSIGKPLSIGDEDDRNGRKDPRKWLRVVGALEQPRFTYNIHQKRFETLTAIPSSFANPLHKTQLFRHRYGLIHQRLLRNEAFQTSSIAGGDSNALQRSSSLAVVQQAYKLTPIANLLGRRRSNHLLLGLLTISPTGNLTLNDLTGSISLDILHARPVPEDGAWFTPGMMVLVDGMYCEEESSAAPGLDGNRGVGGAIGGKFIAFSVGGPPCERRDVTLGVTKSNKTATPGNGSTFGWVDFLGVGSEKAVGPIMRKLEMEVLKADASQSALKGRCRMLVFGEVQLDDARTLQALSKVLGLYATDEIDQSPMTVVLIGNFVHHAVMAGGSSSNSIEYKEYFDSLAATLSDYPLMLQCTTFVFVPGDNDPWASAFSAGAATVLPRNTVPELFTSRITRVFAVANAEAEKANGRRRKGEAIWSSNPSRLTLFGPTHEIVLFRDDISGRIRRNALRFRSIEGKSLDGAGGLPSVHLDRNLSATEQRQAGRGAIEADKAVRMEDSQTPASMVHKTMTGPDCFNLKLARKLVKTVLDQGHLSPFPLSDRPVLWDHSGALQLYPLPTALILMDPEAPPFAITYEGCHVMNPGPFIPPGKRGVAQWIEYSVKTRRGNMREIKF